MKRDYFICNAHSPPLDQAPTGDRLSFLHAVMNALQDTVAMSFRHAYESEMRRSAMQQFPFQVLLASESVPTASASDTVIRDQ